MATIDSYVVHSRINAVSPGTRRRVLLLGLAAMAGVAIVAGVVFSGHAGTPWRAKFEARVAAETSPYPSNQEDEDIAAFQQSVAISHLTTVAPAPLETAHAVSPIARPPRVQKPVAMVVRKAAPAPPPRPAAAEVTIADKAPPAAAAAPVSPPPKTPVLIEIVQRIEHAPNRVVDFANGVTARLLSLRTKGGF